MNKVISKYKNLSKMAKASFWFLICSFIQKGISLITTPIFTRIMNPTEYGTYNVFNSWENIISIIITLNLYYGVFTQGLVKFENDSKSFSSSMQGITFVLVLFWTLVYLVFHNFFNDLFSLNMFYILIMLFMIWITAVFGLWAAEQKVNYNYKKLVIITILASICNPIFSILLMHYFEDKVLARILGISLSYLIFYFWMFFSQLQKGEKFYSKKYWKYALYFNIPLIPHYLSQTILNSSDRIMISKMINTSSAGIYGLAYSISLIMTLFNNALSQTLSPWIYKKIKSRKIGDIKKIAYPALIGIALINIILIAFAPEVVSIFAPSEYYDAIWIIPPVAMSAYFMFAYDLFAKFEFYFEKTKLISFATVIGAIVNIVSNYIFIRIFGYIAAGYTTLVCYILYALFHYIFMYKISKKEFNGEIPYETKTILLITFLFLGIGFYFLILYTNIYFRYISIAFIFMICIIYRRKITLSVKKILKSKKEGKQNE